MVGKTETDRLIHNRWAEKEKKEILLNMNAHCHTFMRMSPQTYMVTNMVSKANDVFIDE